MASTYSTVPASGALITRPIANGTSASIPVPTTGEDALNKGTACDCMFVPIKARIASSCAMNGISEAATPTTWRGTRSIYSIFVTSVSINSPSKRAGTRFCVM